MATPEEIDDALQLAEDALARAWDQRQRLIRESLRFEPTSVVHEFYRPFVAALDDVLGEWTPTYRITQPAPEGTE